MRDPVTTTSSSAASAAGAAVLAAICCALATPKDATSELPVSAARIANRSAGFVDSFSSMNCSLYRYFSWQTRGESQLVRRNRNPSEGRNDLRRDAELLSVLVA